MHLRILLEHQNQVKKSYQRINCFPVSYQTSPSHPFFCFNPPPRWGEGEVSQKVGSRVLFWFSSFLSSPKKFCLSVWEVYIFYFISFLTSDSILFGRVQSKNGCRNQAIRLPCGWCSWLLLMRQRSSSEVVVFRDRLSTSLDIVFQHLFICFT